MVSRYLYFAFWATEPVHSLVILFSMPSIMTMILPRYVGLSEDKLPHGWGEMDYQSGSSYSGHWAQGLREGCGLMVTLGALTSRWRERCIVRDLIAVMSPGIQGSGSGTG